MEGVGVLFARPLLCFCGFINEMRNSSVSVILRFLAVVFLATGTSAPAMDQYEQRARALFVEAVVAPESSQSLLLENLVGSAHPCLEPFLQGWQREQIFIYQSPEGSKIPILKVEENQSVRILRVDTGEELKEASGSLAAWNPEWKAVETNSKIRRSLKNTIDLLALGSSSPSDRAAAALKLGLKQSPASLPVLESRLSQETNPSAKAAFLDAIALVSLNSENPDQRTSALQRLGESASLPARDAIKRLADDSTQPPQVSRAAREALQTIDTRIFWIDFFGTVFRGISLGSVLLIVALGLAITFGLMGVINMAHGEIMIVGGYATFVVQCVFGNGLAFAPFGLSMNIPGFGFDPSSAIYQSYFLVALPVAFLSAAATGYVLERGVIRFLYRRPLESLLATWGASLVMQQLFRLIFGPANVPVASPEWINGSLNVEGVLMNYNRLFVIVFAAAVVFGTSLLLTKTPLGLLIRAVMQDRSMAGCMGVPTTKVNTLTFSFGCGLAGLAGAFLSQIGNIGPGTGQTYIVDAFMVVVLGGVGSLTGTVLSALGIGTLDQILQTTLRNPVIGKVLVLAGLIVFLQFKPSGLFSAKSRNLEES